MSQKREYTSLTEVDSYGISRLLDRYGFRAVLDDINLQARIDAGRGNPESVTSVIDWARSLVTAKSDEQTDKTLADQIDEIQRALDELRARHLRLYEVCEVAFHELARASQKGLNRDAQVAASTYSAAHKAATALSQARTA